MNRDDAAKILSVALDAWTADLAATARLAGAREALRVAMLSPHLTASIATARRELAAAEAAIGLAILVVFFRNRGTIDVEDVNVMKG